MSCSRANREFFACASVCLCAESDRAHVASAHISTKASADNLTQAAAAVVAERGSTARGVTAAAGVQYFASADCESVAQSARAFIAQTSRLFTSESDRCAPVVDIDGLCGALKVYIDGYVTDFEGALNWPIAPACQ